MHWSGIGVNYGHQIYGGYSTSQVESDLTYLTGIGVKNMRVVFPTYSDSGTITNAQDIVARAKNHGFYTIFGVATGVASGLNATTWAAFKSYISGTLLTWAVQNRSILDELCVGNECDLEVDGTTLTAATARSDMRAMATTVKNGGYTGIVSYAASMLNSASWISEGIGGSLDRIGFNSYDTLANFQSTGNAVLAAFGNKVYLSEFGSRGGGYPDFNNEEQFYIDSYNRVLYLQQNSFLSGYFFTYRDTTDTFALMRTNNVPRIARQALGNATQRFLLASFHR